MVENPTVRLHALARGRAEEVKFGRWLRNPSVTTAELVEDCGQRLASQVAGLHVLAIQDTTELNYERHAGRTCGLGTVGNGTDRGLLLHPMLAIEASGKRCLGLVGAEVWTRFECVEISRRNRPIEDKESHRWLRGAERAKQVLRLAARVTVVADRESDIYEAFARLPGPNFDLLSRAAQDRKIAEGGCLFATPTGCRSPAASNSPCGAVPASAKAASPSSNCASAPSLSNARATSEKPKPLPGSPCAWSTCAKPPPCRPARSQSTGACSPPMRSPIWRRLSRSSIGIGNAGTSNNCSGPSRARASIWKPVRSKPPKP